VVAATGGNRITLVSGGGRSGKSSYALSLAPQPGIRRLFIATCPPVDAEMEARIARHREERRGKGWETLESTLLPAGDIEKAAGYGFVVIDCLSLWVNNLMYEADKAGKPLDESLMAEHAASLVSLISRTGAEVVLVTNEVGMGIIPDNAASRLYRDLLGRCNQVVAGGAGTVVLMTCGIPMVIKGGN
jgi:adenosylcobinamide kinase/adenosylcobinamide-phosphate guanylyltransferase